MGFELWERHRKPELWRGLSVAGIDSVFPALTCPVQASFRTGGYPSEHGVVANGFYDRRLRRPFFWEQSSALCEGSRIWDDFRENRGGTVGQICWQQSLGPESDLLLSPAPIHKHHGGMIQDFYSRPSNLYGDLSRVIGKFNLHSYWGPFTSAASSKWITKAAVTLLDAGKAADLQLVYLPHLDYELQKSGPNGVKISAEFAVLEDCVAELLAAARRNFYEVVVFGDYAMEPAEKTIFPNRILVDKGFMACREVEGMLYPDFHNSAAFAMVDHQVAHVYVADETKAAEIADAFAEVSEIRNVFAKETTATETNFQKGSGGYINHPNSGELILEAAPGAWFAYPWWSRKSEMPDYATHVDIHNKPGFDPCELFLSLWPPMSVSTDAGKVGGTHGLTDKPVLFASTFDLGTPADIAALGRAVGDALAEKWLAPSQGK